MNRSGAGICLIASAFLVLAAVAVSAGGESEGAAATAGPEAAAPTADFAGLDRDTYFTVAEFERLTGRTIAQYNESPMTAALVAEGKLPPVEERLPEQPLVQLPFSTDKSIGKYGGTLQINSWTPYMGPTSAEKQHFISAEKEYTQNIFPNLAESFESPDGGKTWIITMRRGLKWSDGTPWSTGDVMFWYDDLANNKEFQPQTNYVLLTGGAPLVFEAVDDITWKIVADAPYHLEENVEDLMTLPPLYPKAYLSQFHPDYADADELAALIKEGGFTGWVDLLENRTNRWSQNANVDKPVMTPWVLIQGAPAKTEIYHRNPYFHAVDIAGNQLPYFDIVRKEVVADIETAKLRALAGQDDMFATGALEFFPVAKQEESGGKIKVTRWAPLAVQHGHHRVQPHRARSRDDEQVFQNRNFRFGVSHAINRELLNELVYSGMLEPQQACESERSPYYNERLCTTAIEFDQAKANELLDAAGLDKRDADNWRLRPDGAPPGAQHDQHDPLGARQDRRDHRRQPQGGGAVHHHPHGGVGARPGAGQEQRDRRVHQRLHLVRQRGRSAVLVPARHTLSGDVLGAAVELVAAQQRRDRRGADSRAAAGVGGVPGDPELLRPRGAQGAVQDHHRYRGRHVVGDRHPQPGRVRGDLQPRPAQHPDRVRHVEPRRQRPALAVVSRLV